MVILDIWRAFEHFTPRSLRIEYRRLVLGVIGCGSTEDGEIDCDPTSVGSMAVASTDEVSTTPSSDQITPLRFIDQHQFSGGHRQGDQQGRTSCY